MLVPFASLITFPRHQQQQQQPYANEEGSDVGRTAVPPPTTHLVCTSNFPAPSNFLPWHYARQTLQEGGRVVWVGCTASGEEHVRLSLRRSLSMSSTTQSTKKTTTLGGDVFVYLDALDVLTDENVNRSNVSVQGMPEDARPLLIRLEHRIEQILQHFRSTSVAAHSSATTLPPVLLILDDAAALAWTIEQITVPSTTNVEEGEQIQEGREQSETEDPRVTLLRNKRKQGSVAIHRDEVGERLGSFIVDTLHENLCTRFGVVLLTHLTADNTSITPTKPLTPATRGGSYGVGTGFDADDAGEEDEAEELYEEHLDGWPAVIEPSDEVQTTSSSFGVAAATVDWRVDSLLRRILLNADVWTELRGLRSGRARDCHGEICTFGLSRPCRARNVPLPNLPLPADPLRNLRRQDRSTNPLKQLSQLSLASSSDRRAPTDLNATSFTPTLSAFKMETWCEGREKAMLFRIDANGEAYAWRRGSAARS